MLRPNGLALITACPVFPELVGNCVTTLRVIDHGERYRANGYTIRVEKYRHHGTFWLIEHNRRIFPVEKGPDTVHVCRLGFPACYLLPLDPDYGEMLAEASHRYLQQR